jgi:amino acid transporter
LIVASAPKQLDRSLRTVDVILLTVGGVIGFGIFLTPGSVLSASGNSPMLALSAWALRVWWENRASEVYCAQ